MKAHQLPLLMFTIPILFPSPAFSGKDYSQGVTKQDPAQINQFLDQPAPLDAAATGLQIIVERLKPLGILELDKEKVQHAKKIGFEAGTDGASVRQDPFPISEVSLRKLRDFTSDHEIISLLIDTHHVLFPIEVKNEVRSSITVRAVVTQGEGTEHLGQKQIWHPTGWGLPKLITRLTAKRKQLHNDTPGLKGFRLVSIPALNRHFLGYEDGTDFKLAPLFSDDLFKEEKPLLAKEAFLRLVHEAKIVDDRPR